MKTFKIPLLIGLTLFFGFLILAIIMLDSPGLTRAKKNDLERLRNLKGNVRAIESFARSEGRLPKNLEELENQDNTYTYLPVDIEDPKNKSIYGYEVINYTDYKICANFEADYHESYNNSRDYKERSWYYKPGEQCFERDVTSILLSKPVFVKGLKINGETIHDISPNSNGSYQVVVNHIPNSDIDVQVKGDLPEGITFSIDYNYEDKRLEGKQHQIVRFNWESVKAPPRNYPIEIMAMDSTGEIVTGKLVFRVKD